METRVLATNIDRIRERIAAAAERSGRAADAIRLIAVTKYVDANVTRQLLACGCRDLGESRPQALWRKDVELADAGEFDWHLIGHLQRNKVRRTLGAPRLAWIHSVDRMELIEALQSAAERTNRSIDILLEVHIAQETAKHGWAPDETGRGVEEALAASHLRLRGLMGMASNVEDMEQVRREFAGLRKLRDRLAERYACLDALRELSMGMSRDFEPAIEAGATMVRIGSLLYEDKR